VKNNLNNAETNYISRPDAARKFKVSSTKLRRLEKSNALRRYRADDVGFPTKGLPGLKWVYLVADLHEMFPERSHNVAQRHRQTVVFNLLAHGINVIDIVRKTKLPVKEIQALRDIYVRERHGLFLPGDVVMRLRDLGFDVHDAETLIALICHMADVIVRGPAALRPVRTTIERAKSES